MKIKNFCQVVVMLFALFPSFVLATPTTYITDPSLGDVTLNGHGADAVSLVQENLTAGAGDADYAAKLNDLFGGDEFTFLAKDEAGTSGDKSNTWNGILFAVTSNTFDDTTGTWEATWTAVGLPGLPATMDLVVLLKAGSGWAAWLFDDELLTVANSGGVDTWTITFNYSKSSPLKDLSHLSLYGRDYASTVPEPTTMLLFGTGLIGLAGLARRKNS